ncbi:hypothetical protein RIR_jg38281.t1 [Rhizophagus irregularis DAOM 181602=DAOM 197198]|nr:hypothetical protein RIR_jg38281.t1 [Rhizophagus irregularis DAOM 181602=DAOM 197198]
MHYIVEDISLLRKNFWSAGGLPSSEERKTKIRKISFGWASKDRKNPKIHKFGGLPKNENPKIRSGSLWSLEKVEPSSGGFPKIRGTKIRSGDFRRMDEPRFVRFGSSGGFRTNEGTKIRSAFWNELSSVRFLE